MTDAHTMGVVSFFALLANLFVAVMLYRFREGDMRSVRICSRNDAIGNVAVMLAARSVFGRRCFPCRARGRSAAMRY